MTKMNNTFDLSMREWGKNYSITSIKDSGQQVSLVGWTRGISSGDYLILKNGSDTTRYIVDQISYFGTPNDMWKAEVTFYPR